MGAEAPELSIRISDPAGDWSNAFAVLGLVVDCNLHDLIKRNLGDSLHDEIVAAISRVDSLRNGDHKIWPQFKEDL